MKDWSTTENLQYLQEKIKSVRTAMLTTYDNAKGFHSRPMGTADVDNEGNIWFFTNEFSPKAKEVSADNTVSLTYAHPGDNIYLSIAGEASLVDNKAKMKELFNPFVKTFFPEGLDDPKLILLKVEPTSAEYWDSNSSKIVVLFNMLKAVVTGEVYDEGKHGKINL